MTEPLRAALDALAERPETIAETLARLLRFESVRPPEGSEDPVGEGIRASLADALALCEQRGMATRVHDGQVGVAELGTGEENVAVVLHLDVVPAGDGWTHPPFAGTVAEGWVWGRGAQDDKGPLASVLHAVDALQAAEVPLRRRITLILGTDEETGFWRDLEAFHRNEPMPTLAFVPDGDFPIVSAEKGFINIRLSFPPARRGPLGRARRSTRPRLLSLEGGDRPNIVPDRARAVVEGLEASWLASRARAFALSRPGSRLTVVEREDGGVEILAEGAPSHGSTPEKGRNAIMDLVAFLAPEDWVASGPASAVGFLDLTIGADLNGERLGIFAEDDFMGFTTVNVGTARDLPDGGCEVRVNIRTVAGQTSAEVAGAFDAFANLTEIGGPFGVELEPTVREPLRVAEDSELVLGLSRAYESVMGEPPGLVSIGGTTFAKGFDNAVAFGPTLPGEEERAHERDERVSLEALLRNARIYAAALEELAGARP